jgi:hypothetical protein
MRSVVKAAVLGASGVVISPDPGLSPGDDAAAVLAANKHMPMTAEQMKVAFMCHLL